MAIDLDNGFKDLRVHIGHEIECVSYGDSEVWNVAIECVTCGMVLLDFDNPGSRGGSISAGPGVSPVPPG